MKAFTRQLGNQVGVQLNPLKDGTGGFTLANFDQVAATVGRFKRGRIDKPFLVNKANFTQMLGYAESINISSLNECYTQIYECLQKGAVQVLVQRLTTPLAKVLWLTVGNPVAFATQYKAQENLPADYLFAIKHLGCFNDGLKIYFHAESKKQAGVEVPNSVITLRICDAKNELIVPEITGSLLQDAVDEYGESFYMGDLLAKYSDGTILFSVASTQASVIVNSDAYGKDANGKQKWSNSGTGSLICFLENGTGYGLADYDRAVTSLKNADEDYGYIFSGGTRALSLIAKLGDLAYDTNRQFVYDIPGEFNIDAVIAFQSSLAWGAAGKDHYPQAYWCPIKAIDPVNGNSVIFGAGGSQVGYRCARNAITNAYGMSQKHYPIAFKDYPLGRVSMTQLYTADEQELSDLALAKVNPVIFKTFNGGSNVVFADVLTCAATATSYRKLITSAEISSHLSEMVARFANECLGLPMNIAIERMKDFLEELFSYALITGWILEPTEPRDAGKKAYSYTVLPDMIRSADLMKVEFWIRPVGTVRQIHITPNLY